MPLENHPNLHAVGLMVDIYSSIEKHLRGDGQSKFKDLIISSPTVRRKIMDFIEDLEHDINNVVDTLKKV